MNVQLDPNDQEYLEALARASGRDTGELLQEIVKNAIADRKRNDHLSDDNMDAIRRQQDALQELHATLDALPPEGPQDSFSGRDHDKLLYGKGS
jgi:hypothetical protein